MRLDIETPSNINRVEISAINTLASLGFGRNETEMLPDTYDHIQNADYIQRAYQNREVVGFALYRRQLWRQSN